MSICNNKSYENKYCLWKRSNGAIAMRIAGSGKSLGAICDCIVIDKGKTSLVEVKACKGTVLYVRETIKQQLTQMRNICLMHSITPIVAVRFKNRQWLEVNIKESVPSKIEIPLLVE